MLGGTWRAVKQAALGRGVAGGFLPRLAAGTMTEWERGSHEETKGVGQIKVWERARDISHDHVPSPSLGPTLLPSPLLDLQRWPAG